MHERLAQVPDAELKLGEREVRVQVAQPSPLARLRCIAVSASSRHASERPCCAAMCAWRAVQPIVSFSQPKRSAISIPSSTVASAAASRPS